MRRLSLRAECRYLTPRDTHWEQRTAWGDWKKACRADLRRMDAGPRFVSISNVDAHLDDLVRRGKAAEEALRRRVAQAAKRAPGANARLPDAKKPTLSDPKCVTFFDANSKVTKMQASARIDVGVDGLAESIDPRGWGLSNGVIDVAFPVYRDDDGLYRPVEGDVDVPLGREWEEPGLLFEYARSEIASFENILMIDEFSVTPGKKLYVKYHLVECLKTIIGFWGVDGGLQRNDGFVRVTPVGKNRSLIEVEKNIRVRDMTPNDPGNRYDFGLSINSTIGAALSVWVDDVSLMSPVF